MKETEIKIEDTSDWRNTRVYHVRQPLISTGFAIRSHEGVNEGETGLAELLLTVPGVNRVQIERYSAKITKAELFTWEEISPEIVKILTDLLNHQSEGH